MTKLNGVVSVMAARLSVKQSERVRFPTSPQRSQNFNGGFVTGLKDILGTTIKTGSTVLTCHNNRIIIGRVAETYEHSGNVKVEPLPFDTDARRDIPRMNPFRRAEYNVFVVSDQDLVIGTLKGYCHNSGEFDEED